MAFRLEDVQAALAEDGLDGWLLYDFHGSNPIARSLAGLNGGGKMTTRRWFYLIPATGTPRALVHAIEPHTLSHLPGDTRHYAGRQALSQELDALLSGVGTLAMEYSPDNAIPYIARVDAGTIEAVRKRGVSVVSSGDLVQRFEALWSPAQLETHLAASAALYRIKDRTFAAIGEHARKGAAFTEYDVQQWMGGWFREEGLTADDQPVVAVDGKRRQPALHAAGGHQPGHRVRRARPARFVGQAEAARRRVRRYHVGVPHRARGPGRTGARLCRDCRRPRRGAGADRGGRARRPGPAGMAGRSGGPHAS